MKNIDKNFLNNLLLEGKSSRDIGEILGLHKNTVLYWIDKYNLRGNMRFRKDRQIKFNTIDTKEKAYILGFLLADSAITETNTVDLKVAINDREVVDFISKELDSDIIESNKINKKTRVFPNIRTYKTIKDIVKFTGGRLKKDRHYPRVKKELEQYLLLGFFDGDGCITWGRRKDRNRLWQKVSFTSQLKLLQGVQKSLYNNLDISSTIHPKSKEKCYVLEFANKIDVVKFLDYIYSDEDFIVLRRKYLKSNALRLELEEFGETTNK